MRLLTPEMCAFKHLFKKKSLSLRPSGTKVWLRNVAAASTTATLTEGLLRGVTERGSPVAQDHVEAGAGELLMEFPEGKCL